MGAVRFSFVGKSDVIDPVLDRVQFPSLWKLGGVFWVGEAPTLTS